MAKGSFSELAREAAQQPLEVLYPVNETKKIISIGVPKETARNENRIPFTPDAARVLTAHGFKVIIESGAGSAAKFNDHDYNEAGALVSQNKAELFSCDYIIKICLPDSDEIEMLQPNQVLITALNQPSVQLNTLNQLFRKRVTAFSFEKIKDEDGKSPILQSMSEIAGKTAILVAAEYLSDKKGKGILFGGITGISSTKVVIIGAGTVGLYAAKTALAMGAQITLFDNSMNRLRHLCNILEVPLNNSMIQPYLLAKALKDADVAIGALRPVRGRTPCVVSTEMVSQMKEKSVIIDVSIDQGGCFETSEPTNLSDPAFTKYDVIHYCVPNLTSKVPQTASIALSNSLLPIFIEIAKYGNLESYLWDKFNARQGIYMYKGILTDPYFADKFNLNSQAIDLLLTSKI